MKNLIEKLGLENVIGGLFATIAVIAIFVEMSLAGFTSEAVAGGIKDLAGTVVTIIVMMLAIGAWSRNKKQNTFESRFNDQMNTFLSENKDMLREKPYTEKNKNIENGDDMFQIFMRTDFKPYFGLPAENGAQEFGRFVLIPEIKQEKYNKDEIRLYFNMNKGTFYGRNKTDIVVDYKPFANAIYTKLQGKYQTDIDCKVLSTGLNITVKKPIQTDEDIQWFISLLDTVYKCYLVLGDSGLTKTKVEEK